MSDDLNSANLFDLSGMKPEDAREYIISMGAHLKQTEAEVLALEEEIQLWNGRTDLAAERGLSDLRIQSQAKVDELKAKKVQLEVEVMEFRDGMEKMKKQLQMLPAMQRNVNTAALQENLEKLGGTLDQVSPTLKRMQAEDALAALKKKLQS